MVELECGWVIIIIIIIIISIIVIIIVTAASTVSPQLRLKGKLGQTDKVKFEDGPLNPPSVYPTVFKRVPNLVQGCLFIFLRDNNLVDHPSNPPNLPPQISLHCVGSTSSAKWGHFQTGGPGNGRPFLLQSPRLKLTRADFSFFHSLVF